MLLNVLNESVVLTSETLPELDIFSALTIAVIGLIAIFVVIRYLIKRNRE